MKMVSKDYIYYRAVIPCIHKFNKNNTRSKFQSDQTYGILQGVINGTGRKQAQNEFNRKSKVLKGEKHKNQLNICSIQC